eukprot:1160935-Pelagomonas_calceolata.AAC.3
MEDLKLAIRHQLKSLGVSSTIEQLLRVCVAVLEGMLACALFELVLKGGDETICSRLNLTPGTVSMLQDLQLQQAGTQVKPNKALELLQERGIIEQLAKSISVPPPASSQTPQTSPYLPLSVPSAPSTRCAGANIGDCKGHKRPTARYSG